MKLEFMVEGTEQFNSDIPYKIIESYTSPEYPYPSYDIYRVEVDDFSMIRVVNTVSNIEYQPDTLIKCRSGNEMVHYVSVWKPVESEVR